MTDLERGPQQLAILENWLHMIKMAVESAQGSNSTIVAGDNISSQDLQNDEVATLRRNPPDTNGGGKSSKRKGLTHSDEECSANKPSVKMNKWAGEKSHVQEAAVACETLEEAPMERT